MTFPHDLILARHGQTEWNAVQRMQGRLNSPLTPTGRQQAAALGRALARLDVPRFDIRISPQGRVVETAAIALRDQGCPIRTDDRLMEIDVGEWSGRLRSELQALRPDLFSDDPSQRLAWYDAAPGGEGYVGLKARAASFLADLTGPTIVLTHGITLRMLRSLAACGDDTQFGTGPGIGQGYAFLIRDGQVHILDETNGFPA